MPSSLKACFPVLGRILNETPDALYARQRSLVRGGVLESVPGRGPGSGVGASARTISLLLISLLTSASADSELTKPIANATHGMATRGGKCPLTGAKTFVDALARILTDDEISRRVSEIRIAVNGGLALIVHDGDLNEVFVAKKAQGSGLRVEIAMSGELIHELTAAVVELLKGDRNEG